MGLRVFLNGGIHLTDGRGKVVLDPHSPCKDSVVSHAHMDHLCSGAFMTPQTMDIMKVRMPRGQGIPLEYGRQVEVGGLPVVLRDAGHVFGSAMVRAGEVLYTGDFNPEGGLTCGEVKAEGCDILVTEATYGRPGFTFPPKQEVMQDILSWTESCLEEGPVALGAYEFGKGQELIALLNKGGLEAVVTDPIANLADVYRRHGLELRYKRLSQMAPDELGGSYAMVVPRRLLRRGKIREMEHLRAAGGKTAFVSGWCSIFNFRRSLEIDAQFPMSDHADFDSLLDFASGCNPRLVYTCNGYTDELAREIKRRLAIPAKALSFGWF